MKNLFAEALALLLASHGKELSSLYSLTATDRHGIPKRAIPPTRVTQLKRSLTSGRTATLNADELDLLQARFGFTQEDLRHLRAALVAETIRHLLEGRIEHEIAREVAMLTLSLMTSRDAAEMQTARDKMIELIREIQGPADDDAGERTVDLAAGTDEPAEAATDPIERALDAALEEYEAGTLWLAMARTSQRRLDRVGYLAQARGLLEDARTLATYPAAIALNTPQQRELLDLIAEALAEADRLPWAAPAAPAPHAQVAQEAHAPYVTAAAQ